MNSAEKEQALAASKGAADKPKKVSSDKSGRAKKKTASSSSDSSSKVYKTHDTMSIHNF